MPASLETYWSGMGEAFQEGWGESRERERERERKRVVLCPYLGSELSMGEMGAGELLMLGTKK